MPAKEFKLLHQVGEGSFSKVYAALRLSTRQLYAVKVVPLPQELTDNQVRNALNEVRILASINHPHIVSYREAFLNQNELYIVMEFATGGDLKRRIREVRESGDRIPESMLWKLAGQMFFALASLHRRKVLHCDLKSANVFITAKGDFKLGDLNVAKVLRKEGVNTQTGTPYYAAPQVWRKENYDWRADYWSLGVVLYQAATQRLPFNSGNAEQLFQQISSGLFEPIQGYSAQLKELIYKFLQTDSSQRPTYEYMAHLPNLKAYVQIESDSAGCKLMQTIKGDSLAELESKLPTSRYSPAHRQQQSSSFHGIQAVKPSEKILVQQSTEQSISIKPRPIARNFKAEPAQVELRAKSPVNLQRKASNLRNYKEYIPRGSSISQNSRPSPRLKVQLSERRTSLSRPLSYNRIYTRQAQSGRERKQTSTSSHSNSISISVRRSEAVRADRLRVLNVRNASKRQPYREEERSSQRYEPRASPNIAHGPLKYFKLNYGVNLPARVHRGFFM